MSAVQFPTFIRSEFPALKAADRLEVLPDAKATDGTNVDWEEINRSVQVQLRRLAQGVRRIRPEIRSRHERTITHLLLFSYCAFEMPSCPVFDDVVAGIDFSGSSTGKAVIVRADLSGEETGVIWLTLTPQEVPLDQEQLRAAGQGMARQLAARVSEVVAAFERQSMGHSQLTEANSSAGAEQTLP